MRISSAPLQLMRHQNDFNYWNILCYFHVPVFGNQQSGEDLTQLTAMEIKQALKLQVIMQATHKLRRQGRSSIVASGERHLMQ